MAPRTRNDAKLKQRISRLRLVLHQQKSPKPREPRTLQAELKLLNSKLCPLYPQPCGPPHPKFPKTILHWLLLTEDELDDLAHYYSQSTPNAFTASYPAPMGWDSEFLERNEHPTPQMMPWDWPWLQHCAVTQSSTPGRAESPADEPESAGWSQTESHYILCEAPPSRQSRSSPSRLDDRLSTAERIAIKRRKLGKFMGLRGCETPVPEMQKRIRFLELRLERAVWGGAGRRYDRGFDGEERGGGRRPRIGKDLL